jgi:subtilisin-like proprotein convertase family protein
MISNFTLNKLVCFIFIISISTAFAQPNNIQTLPCGSPDAFSLTTSGFVGSNPTTAASSCGQCCYQGSDLDGDGDQDVSYSVENSVWYEYCNSTGSSITIDIVIDEVFNNCNVQGAVFTGNPSSMDVDCSNPGFQEYGSNPGGNGDGFTFTVTLAPSECAWVMIDGYGGATCSDLTIEVPCCTAPTSLDPGNDATICENGSVVLDATLSGGLVAPGGPTYSWSPITGLSCSSCEDPTASPTNTTTYTLTACNDANGTACCLTDQVTVTVIPAFIPDAGADITACAPSTLSIGGSPTGPNGSSYAWAVVGGNNSGIAITGGATSANPTVTINTGATGSETYEVTVTNGPCVFTDQVTVTVGPLAVDAGLPNSVCAGQSIVIGGAPTAPLGSSFSWSCTNCTDISLSSNSVANPTLTAGPSASGTATFTVQATLGTCINTASVDITIDPLPATPTASASPATVCAGSNTTLSAAGGAGSGSYTWWDAATGGTQIGSGNTLVVAPVSATTYFIESTDPGTGCVSFRSAVLVNTTLAAIAAAGNDGLACDGNTFSLTGAVSNPEACGTQTWAVVSGSGSFSPSNSDLNAVFTPTTTGTIELSLTPCTSGSGCPVVSDNVILTVSPSPVVVAWAETDTLCFGESQITAIHSTTTGGAPAPTSITSTFPSASGPFSIPNNDCATGVSVPITVSGVADPVVGATTVSVCLNIDLNNVDDIKIEICAPSGTPCVTLVPAPNNGTSGNNFTGTCFTDASATDIAAGSAPFTGSFNPFGTAAMSDFNGVSTNGTWTMTVYDCAGGPSGDFDDWTISFDTPLPNDPYTYAWTSNAGVSDPAVQSTVFSSVGVPISTVTKTMTATDDNNCTGSMDVEIEIIDCTVLLDLEKPLSLLSFKGEKHDDTNMLTWEVASDVSKDIYIIERSDDGINFQNLESVLSLFNVQPYTYTFSDALPGTGNKYYRLKVIDTDERFEYSNIVVLNHPYIKNQDGIALYPNPTKDFFWFEFNSENISEFYLEVKNTIGQVLISGNHAVTAGLNKFKLNLKNFPSSAYFVYVTINGQKIQRKLIKY